LAALTSAPALAAGPVATIPFHLVGTAIVLPVQIEHSDTLWFVLDTGAAAGSVNLPVAERLGLEFGGKSTAEGAAGAVESKQLKPSDVRLGAITLPTERGSSFPYVGLAPRMGHTMDGIVGSELFRRYVVEVDYAHSTLRLYEPSGFHYAGTGERIPLTYTFSLPYMRAAIALRSGRRLE